MVGLLVSLVLIGRVVSSGHDALSEGHEARLSGNELRAVVAYREAISWYLPLWSPWRAEACDALWELYREQESQGRISAAVQSLQSLRAGLRSADSLWRPDKALKSEVDAALAPLMARWEAEDAKDTGRASPGTLEERIAHHAALLAQDERPARTWGGLAVLGFVLWVASMLRALSGASPHPTRLYALSALGFIAFIAGLSLA